MVKMCFYSHAFTCSILCKLSMHQHKPLSCKLAEYGKNGIAREFCSKSTHVPGSNSHLKSGSFIWIHGLQSEYPRMDLETCLRRSNMDWWHPTQE